MNLEQTPKLEGEGEDFRLFKDHERGSLGPIPAGTIGKVMPYPNKYTTDQHIRINEVVVRFKGYGDYFVNRRNLYPRDD